LTKSLLFLFSLFALGVKDSASLPFSSWSKVTITPADRQLLLKMTTDADNSPFHAARLAESFTPTRNMNMTFDHDEKGRLAESFFVTSRLASLL
jgi:hypothetical protein